MRRSSSLATVLFALFSCAALPAWAQKVHLINVADTNDPKVGEACMEEQGHVGQIFFFGLPERMLEFVRVDAEEVTRDNIMAEIAKANVKPNDTLVFYWVGHGGFDTQKKEHYLQLPGGARLYRSELRGALDKKQARLTVLLTDSCANFTDTDAGVITVAPASPDPRRGVAPLFDELFLKPKGVVDINAAAPGEVAIAFKQGGLFGTLLASPAFFQQPPPNSRRPINEYMIGYLWVNMQRRATWPVMLDAMQAKTKEIFPKVRPGGVEHPDGRKQTTQTITSFALPETKPLEARGSRFGTPAAENGGDGVRVTEAWAGYPGSKAVVPETGEVLSLQRGDVILEINGRAIHSLKDYAEAVKASPATMDFVIRSAKTGQRMTLRAKLRD